MLKSLASVEDYHWITDEAGTNTKSSVIYHTSVISMIVNKAYKFELKVSSIKERVLLAKHAGVSRFAYNWDWINESSSMLTIRAKINSPMQ